MSDSTSMDIDSNDVNSEESVLKENEELTKQCPPKENSAFNEKSNSDVVFKKPAFIGPKRNFKGVSVKPSVTKLTSSEEEVAENSVDTKSVSEKTEASKSANFPPLPYSEPIWKGTTSDNYTLEELKSGVIQSTTNLQKKSFFVFGRIDCCDVVMAHPTISRYHAVLQYRGVPDGDEEKGFYLYDLDSTHGTFLNKARLKPKVYARVRVGHMIKFGCSTRFFVLQGPEYDQEEESAMTFSEIKEKRRQELLERKQKEEEEERLKEEEEEKEKKLIEERGISWGLGEDADEEEDLSENPYAITTNEELYIDDPKKALRQWFEREGEEMELETEQVQKGMMVCKIVLPLDDERGKEITVESSARSKKEAQTQCSLEACRIIDRMGLFRQAKQEAKKRQTRNWEENDYYDSDEDSFLDRTGDLDAKRQKRMRKVGKIQETVETYESLMSKHVNVTKGLEEAERKLQALLTNDQSKSETDNDDLDALDAFMKNLKNVKPGKLDIKIAKDEIAKLKKEEEHLRKLINIVKPTSMPELKPFIPPKKNAEEEKNSKTSNSDLDTVGHSSTNFRKSKASESVLPPDVNVPQNERVKCPENDNMKTAVIGPEIPTEFKKRKNRQKVKSPIVTPSLEDPTEEDYTNLVWQPPKGQTGDGKTSLNEKYGY